LTGIVIARCNGNRRAPGRRRACARCAEKKLTIGVLHRVEELADRKENFVPPHARTYERMVPLAQVLGACLGTGPASKKVAEKYRLMLGALGPELSSFAKYQFPTSRPAPESALPKASAASGRGNCKSALGTTANTGKYEYLFDAM